MKNRWQKSLESAVAGHGTPMPWERGAPRNAMILRRKKRTSETGQPTTLQANRA